MKKENINNNKIVNNLFSMYYIYHSKPTNYNQKQI